MNKKSLITALKILFTVVLLYVVFTKIEFEKIKSVLADAQILPLLLAGVLLFLSQWISAERLRYLLAKNTFNISKASNYALYLLGMFYNFFIPGGIGGDAYKVYAMHKKFDWSAKKLTAVLFIDRLTGLAAIGVLTCLLAIGLPLFQTLPFTLLLIGAVPVGLVLFYLIVKQFFPSFKTILIRPLLLSILIQGLQVLSLIALLYSISEPTDSIVYAVVFLVSSALSIFSFSGIGIRELIFYQAAVFFAFDSTLAVTVGFLFSFITAVISLFGIIYHIKKPDLKLEG